MERELLVKYYWITYIIATVFALFWFIDVLYFIDLSNARTNAYALVYINPFLFITIAVSVISAIFNRKRKKIDIEVYDVEEKYMEQMMGGIHLIIFGIIFIFISIIMYPRFANFNTVDNLPPEVAAYLFSDFKYIALIPGFFSLLFIPLGIYTYKKAKKELP